LIVASFLPDDNQKGNEDLYALNFGDGWETELSNGNTASGIPADENANLWPSATGGDIHQPEFAPHQSDANPAGIRSAVGW